MRFHRIAHVEWVHLYKCIYTYKYRTRVISASQPASQRATCALVRSIFLLPFIQRQRLVCVVELYYRMSTMANRALADQRSIRWRSTVSFSYLSLDLSPYEENFFNQLFLPFVRSRNERKVHWETIFCCCLEWINSILLGSNSYHNTNNQYSSKNMNSVCICNNAFIKFLCEFDIDTADALLLLFLMSHNICKYYAQFTKFGIKKNYVFSRIDELVCSRHFMRSFATDQTGFLLEKSVFNWRYCWL